MPLFLALVLLAAGCGNAGLQGEPDHRALCANLGLAPGTDAFDRCMEQQRRHQADELDRIRRAREAGRRGTNF